MITVHDNVDEKGQMTAEIYVCLYKFQLLKTGMSDTV